uniref:Sperm-associated antigen 16 protein n=1 Tax=Myripristis murdjan TaxID=586833 RepID=A0A667XHR6_9TELE
MATSKGREADSLNAADDLQVEEVALEDDWRVTEGEEDWEATMRAIRARAEASAAAAAYGRDTGAAACPAQQPEATDDFLRNFLTDTGMTNTLECFQSEWHEMVQKGLIKTESIVSVPDVYTENQHLENELRNTKREQEEYLRAAAAAAEALTRARKARDYYRLQHKCVVQEKSKLIQEMRKLKLKCASYEPAVRQMNEKYQAALKQMMLVSLERDKALGQETHLETVFWLHYHSMNIRIEQGQGIRNSRSHLLKSPHRGVSVF